MKTKLLLGFVALFVLAQFIRPARNVSTAPTTPADLATRFPPPPEVQRSLERACYDCHSNNTRYPWYAQIQPVGWWLARHVKDGKRHLNFNEFFTYSPKKQAHRLRDSVEEIEQHEMPLPSYVWIHRDAKLSPEDIAALRAWFEEVARQLAAQG